MPEIKLPSMLPGYDQFSRVSERKPLEGVGVGQVGGAATSSQSFLDTLKSMVSEVNEAQVSADKVSQDFASGKARDLHEVMIAVEKADLALRTVTAVRNKVVEAYNEVMRMPV